MGLDGLLQVLAMFILTRNPATSLKTRPVLGMQQYKKFTGILCFVNNSKPMGLCGISLCNLINIYG
jgi:hypothetical protein